jgi:predicted ATP-binding protein involved in virulence
MRIKSLQVTNLRAFEHAEFKFMPGINLLVGVNGVGKTTILDALRVCMSKFLPNITASRSRKLSFNGEDIRVQSDFMTVECTFELQDEDLTFLVHKNRESSVPWDSDNPREQVLNTPDKEQYYPPLPDSCKKLKKSPQQLLGLFFSTRRSLLTDAIASTEKASGGQKSAFADALTSRELRLVEMAYWMRAQEEQAAEYPLGLKHLSALQKAAEHFLPEYKNLRAETSTKPRLIVEKEGMTLDLRQLSDGERGMFALVLDLAKRLSQANPHLENPIRDGSAIVLIDEIDLHLHPKWQREIVKQLTETFPKCQFIATTHSPQIIAAVEPENVLLLSNSEVTYSDRTLGLDSNWILRHLMEADDRPSESSSAIREVELLVKNTKFKDARAAIAKYRNIGLDLPEWSVLEARMARMELLAE